jgi:hypothetical protein
MFLPLDIQNLIFEFVVWTPLDTWYDAVAFRIVPEYDSAGLYGQLPNVCTDLPMW